MPAGQVLQQVLAKSQKELLAEWLQVQLVAGTSRSDLMKESELREQAREFLALVQEAARAGDVRNVAAASLRTAAEEMLPPDDDDRTTFAVLRMRLTDADARRFARRLEKLERDFMAANDPKGKPYGLVAMLFRRTPDA